MSMNDDTCIDANTLAAWADEALDPRERARVEAHAAGCERCQATLAALVRTLPPVEAASRWRMPALGWLVPLTAAATALAIWVAVPAREPLQRSQTAEPAEVVAAPAPGVSARSAPTPESAADRQQPKEPVEARSPRDDVRERRESDAPLRTDTLQKASPGESANALTPASPGASPAASAASGRAEASAAPSPSPAPSADAAGKPAASLATQRALSAFANVAETVVVSSNPATRFRLIPGGGVQRSADGGATWRTESTGATDTLTAGSSPSPSVCWLVGPNGTVVLTTGGSTWRRVAFPERVDLQTIVAADAENATVRTADGRSFVTTDGGSTWSRPPDF